MKNHRADEERPPLFPHWRHWYALVLAELIFCILLFIWFTRAFS